MAEVINDGRLGDYLVWRFSKGEPSTISFGSPLPHGVGAVIQERGESYNDFYVVAFVGLLAKFGGLPHDSHREMGVFLATQGLEVVDKDRFCVDSLLQLWCSARKKEKSDAGEREGAGAGRTEAAGEEEVGSAEA